MGLDMYLDKEVNITMYGSSFSNKNMHEERNKDIMTSLGNFFPELNKISCNKADLFVTKTESVGYWRKVNAIHNWFVKNVQNGIDDCGKYKVELEHLESLLADIDKVLSADKDKIKNIALDILPPTSGFFFGSTKIDEYYLESLEDTRKICKRVIGEMSEDINREEKKEEDNIDKGYYVTTKYYYISSW